MTRLIAVSYCLLVPQAHIRGFCNSAAHFVRYTNVQSMRSVQMDTSYKGTLSIMEAGRTFTGFFINADGTLLKRDLNVFYTRSDSPIETGALWWCDAGKQVQNEEECLPISEIDELFLGKQTSEFELPGTEDVDDKLCISLIGKRATINLQAATKDMLRTWTMGLTGLLQTSGKQVTLLPPLLLRHILFFAS